MMEEGIHGLLTPENCVLVLIDYQPQMMFAVENIDGQTLINNAVALAKTAKLFGVPIIPTTVSSETFSGPMFEQLQEVFPDIEPIDRTSMNSWEDKRVVNAIEGTGRKKLLLGGLWTEVCVVFPAISALEDGYEVYVAADACGDITDLAHDMAMERMIQAGAVPMNAMQFLYELQRDWERHDTVAGVVDIIKKHQAPFGVGMSYFTAVRERARQED